LPQHDHIADPGLAELGDRRITYAARAMPLLSHLARRFAAEQPFAGLAIAACLNAPAETASLARS
jgi:adenosylhomocysteinase